MPKYPRKSDYNTYTPKLPCEGKRVFADEKTALVAADLRMLDHLGLEIAVYQCNVCGHWHLTSVKKGSTRP